MAVSIISTLYPPILETYQPAFIYTDKAPVTFSISSFNSIENISKIHVSVVDQRNNSNVLKNSLSVQYQMQDEEEGEQTQWHFCIKNGILIAEMPDFSNQKLDIEKIGLFQHDSINDIYAIDLDPQWLNRDGNSNYWNNNQYYQIQIRFDSNTESLDEINANYLIEERAYFSEWSSITLIKPILEPYIFINQLEENTETGNQVQIGNFRITGGVGFNTENIDNKNGVSIETERLQAYKIKAFIDEQEIFDSGWIYAKQNILKNENANIDYLLDFSNYQNDQQIILKIYCRTNNNYLWNKKYLIVLTEIGNDVFDKDKYRWNENLQKAKDIEINQEDGSVIINFSAEFKPESAMSTGIFYFRRGCSKDNFKTWDLVYCYQLEAQDGLKVTIPTFVDNTVGSLYEYKYKAQFYKTVPTGFQDHWDAIEESNSVYPKFYDMLLMRQNKQIAIRYNGQISSWKPTVNRQKIDTLGGRYPKFVENATMNYKTYSISGLISAEEDFNRTFLSEFNSLYSKNISRYDEEFGSNYMIRNDTYPDKNNAHYRDSLNEQIFSSLYPTQTINQQRTKYTGYGSVDGTNSNVLAYDLYPHDNWYWEREFREELVNWLNDGEPKLYRSMPEGNIVVMLTDVNLTPNTQLGRRLYNFTATMYEVGDGYNLQQLSNLGIIDIPTVDVTFINGVTASGNISSENRKKNIGLTVNKVGQIIISSAAASNQLINSTNSTKDTAVKYDDFWNLMTVKDRLDNVYSGDIRMVIDDSIKIKGADIYFNSSPHYFNFSAKTNSFEYGDNKKTSWLGYILYITQAGMNEQQIFVNQKGYYHIPSDIDIINLRIPSFADGSIIQQANIFYKYSYVIKQDEKTQVKEEQILNPNLIGQYSSLSSLPLNENIISLIKENYIQNIYENESTKPNLIQLKEILGLSLDITPYSYLIYRYSNDSIPMIVGETGVFDSFEDWPLESLRICGRRMTKVDKYPTHMEEYNYYKDETVVDDNPIPISNLTETPTASNIISINGKEYHNIDEQWQEISNIKDHPETYGFLSTKQVEQTQNLKFNTVYTFLKELKNNGNKVFYYQIYYIDGNWYPITWIRQNADIKIVAAVPIYGLITYRGRLVKEVY